MVISRAGGSRFHVFVAMIIISAFLTFIALIYQNGAPA
jgi:hypothetical protein